jgi:hypothetical protein
VTQLNGTHDISPDSYEGDDTYSMATIITLNDLDVQPHSFHDVGDVDWVKFYGLSGQKYTIKASNLSVICDAIIELYDSDGTTRLVGPIDYADAGEDEFIPWNCTKNGIYYVKISNDNSNFGENVKYDFKIYRPIGPLIGFIEGTITDTISGLSIAGVQISSNNNASALSLPNGSYLMVHPAGTFTVTAKASGYTEKSSAVTIIEGEAATINFGLVPVGADSDGDGVSDNQDNCPNIANTNQANNDHDAWGDVCDDDDDNDGMPDAWENQHGLNPFVDDASEDADGDGYTNLEEYQSDSNPNDPNSTPKSKAMPWIPLLLDD